MNTKIDTNEVELLINAIQVCIDHKINKFSIKKNSLQLIFDKRVMEKNNKLKIFHEIVQGYWDKTSKIYTFNLNQIGDLPLFTNFLMLSRLSKKNLEKLATSQTKFAKFLKRLRYLKKEQDKSYSIHNIEQIREILFSKMEQKNITYRELSNLTGLSQAALHNFRSGGDIKLSNFINFANALGMHIILSE